MMIKVGCKSFIRTDFQWKTVFWLNNFFVKRVCFLQKLLTFQWKIKSLRTENFQLKHTHPPTKIWKCCCSGFIGSVIQTASGPYTHLWAGFPRQIAFPMMHHSFPTCWATVGHPQSTWLGCIMGNVVWLGSLAHIGKWGLEVPKVQFLLGHAMVVPKSIFWCQTKFLSFYPKFLIFHRIQNPRHFLTISNDYFMLESNLANVIFILLILMEEVFENRRQAWVSEGTKQ